MYVCVNVLILNVLFIYKYLINDVQSTYLSKIRLLFPAPVAVFKQAVNIFLRSLFTEYITKAPIIITRIPPPLPYVQKKCNINLNKYNQQGF